MPNAALMSPADGSRPRTLTAAQPFRPGEPFLCSVLARLAAQVHCFKLSSPGEGDHDCPTPRAISRCPRPPQVPHAPERPSLSAMSHAPCIHQDQPVSRVHGGLTGAESCSALSVDWNQEVARVPVPSARESRGDKTTWGLQLSVTFEPLAGPSTCCFPADLPLRARRMWLVVSGSVTSVLSSGTSTQAFALPPGTEPGPRLGALR